jgi:hypothetical protein
VGGAAVTYISMGVTFLAAGIIDSLRVVPVVSG